MWLIGLQKKSVTEGYFKVYNISMYLQIFKICFYIMLFYPTIARKYFVKTQTYVALFGPHELSLIFSGGMCLELTSL